MGKYFTNFNIQIKNIENSLGIKLNVFDELSK